MFKVNIIYTKQGHSHEKEQLEKNREKIANRYPRIPPIKQRMRSTPLGFEKEEEEHLQELLQKGIVKPSSSEWASPPVLFRQKVGKLRYCID